MYAWETFRLRRDAATQNTLIATQITNTLQQNQLMSEQLRVMADGLQFQHDCIENDDQPLFEVTVAHSNEESCSFVVESLKENIWFKEFRSNDALIKSYRNDERHVRKFIAPGGTPRNIYLAIVYKTIRGKTGHAIYQYYTGHSRDQIKLADVPDDAHKGWAIIQKSNPVL